MVLYTSSSVIGWPPCPGGNGGARGHPDHRGSVMRNVASSLKSSRADHVLLLWGNRSGNQGMEMRMESLTIHLRINKHLLISLRWKKKIPNLLLTPTSLHLLPYFSASVYNHISPNSCPYSLSFILLLFSLDLIAIRFHSPYTTKNSSFPDL